MLCCPPFRYPVDMNLGIGSGGVGDKGAGGGGGGEEDSLGLEDQFFRSEVNFRRAEEVRAEEEGGCKEEVVIK